MKHTLYVLLLSLLVALPLQSRSLADDNNGEAGQIAQVMRKLQGLYQAKNQTDMYVLSWEDCVLGTPAPPFPPNDFYKESNDDPDKMAAITKSLVLGFWYTAPGFTPTSDLEGQTELPSNYSEEHWSKIPTYDQTIAGAVTAANYAGIVNAIRGYLGELKYVVREVTRPYGFKLFLEQRGEPAGQVKDSLLQWYGEQNSPNDSWSDIPGDGSWYVDNDTDGHYGSISVNRMNLGVYLGNGETAKLYMQVSGLSGWQHVGAPVDADSKWHKWKDISDKGQWISPIVGEDGSGEFTVFAPKGEDGWSLNHWTMDRAIVISQVQPREKEDSIHCCKDCSTGGCQTGDASGAINTLASVHSIIPLGLNVNGVSSGSLFLYALRPSSTLANRSSIRSNATAQWINDQVGIRQIVSPYFLTDLVTITPQKYEIRFFDGQHIGAFTNGLYQPVGDPNKVIVIEDIAGDGTRLQITSASNGASVTDEFDWNNANQQWSLTRGDGSSVEDLSLSWNQDQTIRTEIRSIKNGTGVLLKKSKTVYQVFPFGEEVVAEVEDPDSLALTTTYTYYTDQAGDGSNYGRLKAEAHPDGYWVRYVYDGSGRISQKITPFQNTAITADDSLCKIDSFSYSGDGYTKTTIQKVMGREISRSYSISASGGYTMKEVACTNTGAQISDPTNLVTTTIYTWFGAGKRVQSVQRPDRTKEMYEYSYINVNRPTGAAVQTMIKTGAPVQSGISDGTQSMTTVDAVGNFVSQQVKDIASGYVLSSSQVTAADDSGRPLVVTYDDGSTEQTSYVGCCGLAGSKTDREGITTAYTYDAFGNVLTETKAGITMIYTYDALNRSLTTTRLGNNGDQVLVQQNHYNVAGQKDSSTNALSQVTTFAQLLNANGYCERDTTYPGGATRVELRNADHTLHALGGTAVHPLQYQYGVDGDGLYTQEIHVGDAGATGEWVKSYIDFAGRNSKIAYPDGATATISYNGLGQMVQETDEDNITTSYTYGATGEQITSTVAGTRTSQTISSVAQYEGKTVLHTETSVTAANGPGLTVVETLDQTPNGRESWTTRYGLTTHMQSVPVPAAVTRTDTVTGPDGSSQITQYNLGRRASLQVLGSDHAQLALTSFDYDQFGRLQTVTDAGRGTSNYSYTGLDEILSTTAPGNLTTINHYNDARQVDWVQMPDGTKQYSTYYRTGELAARSGSQTYTVAYSYDAQGRQKTLVTHGAGGVATTTWNYSPDRGFLVSKIYADGKGTSYPLYSPAGRLIQRVWARGVTTSYGYNATGDLASIDYSDGTPPVRYGYDGQRHRISVTDGSGTRTLRYTDDGQLTTETYTAGLLAGMSTTRSYDGLLRRSGLTANTSGKTLSQAYGYDAGSRINSIRSGAFTAIYTYVSNTNLLNQTSFSHAGGATLTASRSYDGANRLTGISTVSSTAGTIASYNYQLNSLGQRTKNTLADSSVWQYTYDAFGQVTNGNHYWSDQTAVAGHQFHYDYDSDFSNAESPVGTGNRTSTTINDHNSVYAPNALNQYSQRTVPGAIDVSGEAAPGATVTINGSVASRKDGYFYQTLNVANDNGPVYEQVTIQGTANGQTTQQTGHDYVPKALESFVYDDDGNILQDGRWNYTWDGENHLVQVETTDDAASSGCARERWKFVYDDDGRRVSKQTYAFDNGAWHISAETRFLFGNWAVIAECNGQGVLLSHYIWGVDLSGQLEGMGGIGGLLQEVRYLDGTKAEAYFPAFDGNGNVEALISAADGRPRAQYEYGPFGEPIRMSGIMASLNPFRFSTHYTDEEGKLYCKHRYYDPTLGRWLNRDSLGESGGLNMFGYVLNHPTMGVDPFGDKIQYAQSAAQVPIRFMVLGRNKLGATVPNLNSYKLYYPAWGCKGLDPEGKATFTIYVDPTNASPLNPLDLSLAILGIVEHEYHHVQIWSTWWNAFADEANQFERRWCCNAEKCQNRAKAYVNAAFRFYMASAQMYNEQFDAFTYGNSFPETWVNLAKTITMLQRDRVAFERERKNWIDSECPKK